MKQTIIANWWCYEYDVIPEGHKNELNDHALERIAKLRKEHYTSGALCFEIDGVDYNGHWEFRETQE